MNALRIYQRNFCLFYELLYRNRVAEALEILSLEAEFERLFVLSKKLKTAD